MLKSLAISKDLAGHAQALTLGDSSALANSDTCSILSTLLLVSAFIRSFSLRYSGFEMKLSVIAVTNMLKVIQRFVQVDGSGGGFRIA